MSDDLRELLWIAAVALPLGIVLGLLLRWRFKAANERFKKWVQGVAWWWYGIFGLFFLAGSIACWLVNRPAYAVGFGCFALLEFGVMVWELLKRERSSSSY